MTKGRDALQNWNRSFESRPRVIEEPRSVEDVVRIVRDVARYPSPVRAAGELHSTTACIDADEGTQLLMRHLDQIAVHDEGARIRVGAGTTMLRIKEALRPLGRELAVSPEIGNATAGSMACCGSKDSWLRSRSFPMGLAQIGSAVTELKLVNARGEVLTVDETGARAAGRIEVDPTLTLGLVRCSYGLCGIVVEVTFDTERLTVLWNRFAWLTVASPFRPDERSDRIAVPPVSAVLDGADTALAFLQPYHGGLLVERRTALGAADIGAEDTLRRSVRDWVWEWGASGATTFLAGVADTASGSPVKGMARIAASTAEAVTAALTENRLTQRFFRRRPLAGTLAQAAARVVEAVPDGLRPPAGDVSDPVADEVHFARLIGLFDKATGPFFEQFVEGYRAYRSDSLVDFSHDRDTFFDFTFWAFPERDWDTLVPDYIRFCRDYTRQHDGYRPALFTEIYFICQDDRSWLSFSADGPVFTLDMVDNRPDDPQWKAMNRAYNVWAVEHGGRPLLNQTKELEATPAVVGRAYGARWQRFSEAVWAANPATAEASAGRFVSRYFQALLSPRP